MSDPTINRMLEDGATMEEIVAQLAAEKAALQLRIEALERICPKRFRARDGTLLIWHCADEDVPEERLDV